MRAQQGVDSPAQGESAQRLQGPDLCIIDVEDQAKASFQRVRNRSTALCAPLVVEDFGVQPMADASPPKWHLAHTSWFFETFILKANSAGYRPFNPQFEYLFNSYYNGVGKPYPRPKRGLLSRPTVAEVLAYRDHVDAHMLALLDSSADDELLGHLCLGLHHEQQHQELLLTDIKYNFGHNPLYPVYGGGPRNNVSNPETLRFTAFAGGVTAIGGTHGFLFDNETPRHEVLLQPFELANRLVTNREYLAFVQDGGYQQASLWLSEGWNTVQQNQWHAPLYWHHRDGDWFEYRLDGLHKLDANLPVVHVSAHEAFAYANWCGHRLPTEFEFETAAMALNASPAPRTGYVESGCFHPDGATSEPTQLDQMFGEVWQWTSSSYGPYPGYRPLPGTLGEYNGKFMSSQLVLRGASCATPLGHARPTYRNFFYPGDQWQFSGIRLAKDA